TPDRYSLNSNSHTRDIHSFPTRRSSDLSRDRDKIKKETSGYQLCRKVLDSQVEPVTNRVTRQTVEEKRTGTNAHDTSHDFALDRSEEHTSELQSLAYLVCRLLLEKKKNT